MSYSKSIISEDCSTVVYTSIGDARFANPDVEEDILQVAYRNVVHDTIHIQYQETGKNAGYKYKTYNQFLVHCCGLKRVSCVRGKIQEIPYATNISLLPLNKRFVQQVTSTYRIIDLNLYLLSKIKYNI